jgi:hypothetical protein
MPKTNTSLERRLARLEKEVEQLKAAVARQQTTKKVPWWHEIAGDFEGDSMFEEIVREGEKLRERQRKEARGGRAARH